MAKLTHKTSFTSNHGTEGSALPGVVTEQVSRFIRPYSTSAAPGLGIEPLQDSTEKFLDVLQMQTVLDFIFEDLEDFQDDCGDQQYITAGFAMIRTYLRSHPSLQGDNAREYRDLSKLIRSVEVLTSQMYNNWLPNLQELYPGSKKEEDAA